jgi:hypothetical protein
MFDFLRFLRTQLLKIHKQACIPLVIPPSFWRKKVLFYVFRGRKKAFFDPFFGTKNGIFGKKSMKICKPVEHIFTQNRENDRKFSEKVVFPASILPVLKSVSIYSTGEYYTYKTKILPIIRQNTTARRSKDYRIF